MSGVSAGFLRAMPRVYQSGVTTDRNSPRRCWGFRSSRARFPHGVTVVGLAGAQRAPLTSAALESYPGETERAHNGDVRLKPMLGRTVILLLAGAAAACSSQSGDNGPDYTSLSQLNAIWSLSGTLSFICNGAPVNENLSGGVVHIFNGTFDAERIALPVSTCGVDAIRFQGTIDLTGAISGNVSTTGSSPLVDTLAGDCSSTSCTGETANTGLFTFALANTNENVYDGTTWQLAITCSDGSGMSLQASGASIANAGTLQESGSTCAGPILHHRRLDQRQRRNLHSQRDGGRGWGADRIVRAELRGDTRFHWPARRFLRIPRGNRHLRLHDLRSPSARTPPAPRCRSVESA